jgi:hypothetical protein
LGTVHGSERTALTDVTANQRSPFAEPTRAHLQRTVAPAAPGAAGTTHPDPVIQLRRSSPARRISAGSPRSARDRLPEPRPSAERLAQAIAEVLAGARPACQLTGLATLDVLRLLARGAGRLGARPGRLPQRPIVDAVHLSEPCDGVVEACAVVNTGIRIQALALRLEGIDGQWRCTAMHLG